MFKFKIIFGILLFVQAFILSSSQSHSQSSSTFGKPLTAESKVIHSEDFIKDGDRDEIVTAQKTIHVKGNIDSIKLTSFNGVINIVEGGVNHDYVKVESQSFFAGAPLHTRIEIYGNGAFAKSLSMVLVAVLFLTYWVV